MAPRPTERLPQAVARFVRRRDVFRNEHVKNRLNIINRETGNRIRNQAIDSETGDVVENRTRSRDTRPTRGDMCCSRKTSSTRSRSS